MSESVVSKKNRAAAKRSTGNLRSLEGGAAKLRNGRKPIQIIDGIVIEHQPEQDDPWVLYDLEFLFMPSSAGDSSNMYFACKTEIEAKQIIKAYREVRPLGGGEAYHDAYEHGFVDAVRDLFLGEGA